MLSEPGAGLDQGGATLLEVLITLVITAFGLLGLATLQLKIQAAEMEAYQRAQAVLLAADMVERISANRGNAVAYATGGANPLGTGDGLAAPCPTATGATRDLCEWSSALKGASERSATGTVGAMIGARGCIEQLQAPNATGPACLPAIYRVTVAWQGLAGTAAPALSCARDLYGSDASRRAIASQITIGLPGCG